MSDLTSSQLAELEADLEALRAELEQLVAATKDGSKPVDLDEPIGRLSRVDAMQQQHLIKANRESHQARLRLVQAALAALKAGRYGECRKCEEPIRHARLKARPEASLCVDCQDELESARG